MNQWLSVSEAAALLGMSARTVRRQCAAGQLPARRVGSVWQVEADAAKSDTDLNVNSAKSDTNAAKSRTSRTPDAAKSDTPDSDRVAEMRAEIQFLRGVIEQLQRDGAETRAALREALKSKAPQLTQGSSPDAPQSPQNGAAGKDSRRAENGAQKPAERDGGPVTYGSIADELEEKLNTPP
jgi:excisionase family DNA binding protein